LRIGILRHIDAFDKSFDNKTDNDRLHSILHSKLVKQDNDNKRYKNDRSRSPENRYNSSFVKIFQFSSSSFYFFSFKYQIRIFTFSSWNDFIFKINNIPTELIEVLLSTAIVHRYYYGDEKPSSD